MKKTKILIVLTVFISFLITSVFYTVSFSFANKLAISNDPFGTTKELNPSVYKGDPFSSSKNYEPNIPGYPESELILYKVSKYTDYLLGIASLFVITKGIFIEKDIRYTIKGLLVIGVIWFIKSFLMTLYKTLSY